MKDASIFLDHDVTIMPIFDLQQVRDQTVPRQRMNEILRFAAIVQHCLQTAALLQQLVDCYCVFHAFHDAGFVGEWQDLIGQQFDCEFLHFEYFVELLQELHSKVLLPQVIVTFDDDVDQFIPWKVAIRG